MNFKNWLLNELTEIDPKVIKWMKYVTPDGLLNYEHPRAFIYSAQKDKLYFNNESWHQGLISSLPKEDSKEAYGVRNDREPGVVGRIAYSGKDPDHWNHNPEKVVPNGEAMIGIYMRSEDEKQPQYIKRTLQLLVQEKLVTKSSFVIMGGEVESVGEMLGDVQIHNNDEQKRLGALQIAMHLGAWPDGRRITAAERKYIMKELGMELITRKHAWQKSLEDNKLLTPGHRFWAQKSESIQ